MASLVQVVSIGSAARSFAQELAESIKAEYGFEVVMGASLGEPKYAYNKDRKQYHAVAILRRLSAALVKGQLGIVGVTEVDLFVPDSDFVFGEADRQSKAAVVSLLRLRPENNGATQNNDLLRVRGRTEMIHEVGHLAGLSHCENPRCVMFVSNVLADTDRKGCNLCHECRAELGRMSK